MFRVHLGRFDKEEEITVDWAVDAKIPEGRSVGVRLGSLFSVDGTIVNRVVQFNFTQVPFEGPLARRGFAGGEGGER